jgi:hypothetical protein
MPWRAVRLSLIIIAAIIGIIGGPSKVAVLFEPEPLAPLPHETHETNPPREQEPHNVLQEPQIDVRLIRS